jgi:hypothetical protein
MDPSVPISDATVFRSFSWQSLGNKLDLMTRVKLSSNSFVQAVVLHPAGSVNEVFTVLHLVLRLQRRLDVFLDFPGRVRGLKDPLESNPRSAFLCFNTSQRVRLSARYCLYRAIFIKSSTPKGEMGTFSSIARWKISCIISIIPSWLLSDRPAYRQYFSRSLASPVACHGLPEDQCIHCWHS